MSLKDLTPPRDPDLAERHAFAVSGEGPSYTACYYCREPIQRVGEDLLNWCESCCLIEGETVEIEEEA